MPSITSTQLSAPSKIIIVTDLGSSLLKVVASQSPKGHGQPEAIGIRPEVAVGVTTAQINAQMSEYKADPLRSMWVQCRGETYAIGDFAADLAAKNYHELSKWDFLEARILAILGLVCSRMRSQFKGFEQLPPVVLGLMMPRNEINPPDREARIGQLIDAAKNFCFRGETFSCNLIVPGIGSEGAGLFLAQAGKLKQQGINPMAVDVPVIQCGERNTSILTYRGGKINPSLSSSDGDGFYRFAVQIQKAIGGSVSLPDLIRAIATKKERLRITGGQVVSLSPHVREGLKAYAQSLQTFFQAKLPTGDIHCIIGGGAISLIWEEMRPWFQLMEIPIVSVGEEMGEELDGICLKDLNPIRFADALGLYKSLAAKDFLRPAVPV